MTTKREVLFQLHAEGKTQEEVFALLRPHVLSQTRPWIFSANVKYVGRVPKSISEQLIALRDEIGRVFSMLDKGDTPSSDPSPTGAAETPAEIPAEEEVKPVKKVRKKEDEKRHFMAEWRRLRKWIFDTSERHGSPPVDSLDSNRPVEAAKRMIDAGISAAMCLHAMTLHWPQATRENAGVQPVDFASESDEIEGDFHALAGYVLKLARAAMGQGFGLMLIGPAGSGKSTLIRQAASLIRTDEHPDGLPYGETPMTPGATRGDLLGRITMQGYVPSQFVEIYSGGGIFNFEEIDASDPSMLIVVNNALASGQLFNSVNGQVYDKHPNFIAAATANTFGLGADSKYTGRERLDLATIDRFRMARVILGLDENLADRIMGV